MDLLVHLPNSGAYSRGGSDAHSREPLVIVVDTKKEVDDVEANATSEHDALSRHECSNGMSHFRGFHKGSVRVERVFFWLRHSNPDSI